MGEGVKGQHRRENLTWRRQGQLLASPSWGSDTVNRGILREKHELEFRVGTAISAAGCNRLSGYWVPSDRPLNVRLG